MMREFIWGKTFVNALKRRVKKNSKLKLTIEDTLRLLKEDPLKPKLETHKLKWKLAGSLACSVDYEYRIVFDFIKNSQKSEDDILLSDISTHDEVY